MSLQALAVLFDIMALSTFPDWHRYLDAPIRTHAVILVEKIRLFMIDRPHKVCIADLKLIWPV